MEYNRSYYGRRVPYVGEKWEAVQIEVLMELIKIPKRPWAIVSAFIMDTIRGKAHVQATWLGGKQMGTNSSKNARKVIPKN